MNLGVWDFDGTLFNTPTRPSDWHGKDWWGNRDSLSAPYYTGWHNEEVVDEFRKAKADPNTRAALCTGRRTPIAPKCRELLRSLELFGRRVIDPQLPEVLKRFQREDIVHPREADADAHEEYFVGDHIVTNKIHGTYGHKKHVFDLLVSQNGGFEQIDIWDDRKDHLDLFIALGKYYLSHGLAKKVTMHRVVPPHFDGAYAAIVHIPLSC